MPDPINPNPAPTDGGADQVKNDPSGATDPNQQKPGEGGENNQFDPSSLSDEQLTKVLEDQRLWKTKRLAELRDKAKKADQYEADLAKREEEELKKKGEFETLSQKNAERAEQAEQKYVTAVTNNAIMQEAAKLGISDLDAAIKLIDRGAISVNDDGSVSGVAEAVKQLATDKPYLVGKNISKNIGSGTNPANPQNPDGTFKMSDVNNPVFYQKHHKAIKLAMAQGKIIDDLN